jgi:plastocyanin
VLFTDLGADGGEMKLRNRYLLPAIVLCTGLAAIPSLATSAGSSTATVSGLESLMWSPMEVAITPGGTVTFKNASTRVAHGIVWTSKPETPACSGVPIDKGEFNWQGSCKFEKEGVYEYYCYVHGLSMSGKVFVNAAGTTTTTTTSSSTTQSTSTRSSTSSRSTTSSTMMMSTTTATSTSPSPHSEGGEGGSRSSSGPLDSLKGGAVSLPASQRGPRLHGSVEVAVKGSTLTVEVFAASAKIAKRARRAQERVGKLVRSALAAGRTSFSIALNAKAVHALRRRRHLRVSVRLALIAPGGARATRTLSVVLHSR